MLARWKSSSCVVWTHPRSCYICKWARTNDSDWRVSPQPFTQMGKQLSVSIAPDLFKLLKKHLIWAVGRKSNTRLVPSMGQSPKTLHLKWSVMQLDSSSSDLPCPIKAYVFQTPCPQFVTVWSSSPCRHKPDETIWVILSDFRKLSPESE